MLSKVYRTFLLIFFVFLIIYAKKTCQNVLVGEQYFVDFTDQCIPQDSAFSGDIDLIDVDQDGDLDAFFTNSARYSPYDGQQSNLYINDGAANFTDETDMRLPFEHIDTRKSAFADFDGDGDLDVILSAASGFSNRLWMNDGNGFFSDESIMRLPPILGGVFSTEPGVGDLDGDGDFDIMLPECQVELPCPHQSSSNSFKMAIFTDSHGTKPLIEPSRVPVLQQCIIECRHRVHEKHSNDEPLLGFYCPSRLLINNGSGFFSDETESRLPERYDKEDRTTGFVFFDIDFDGDLDIFEAHSHSSVGNRMLLNNGHGFFEDVSEARMPLNNHRSQVGRVADYDADGNLDIFLCSATQHSHLLMNRNGFFRDETLGWLPNTVDSSYSWDTGDINNDGWPDLVCASSYITFPIQNILLLNEGGRYFSDVTRERLPLLRDQTRKIQFGDLDNDGDVDLISANTEEQNRLYLNVGNQDIHPPRIFGSMVIEGVVNEPGPISLSTHVIDYVSVNIGEIDVKLCYRLNGGEDVMEKEMVWRGGRLFYGEIPAQEPGTEVSYYFRAIDKAGNVSVDPHGTYTTTLDHQSYHFTVHSLLALSESKH